jgi:hypothetical protein
VNEISAVMFGVLTAVHFLGGWSRAVDPFTEEKKPWQVGFLYTGVMAVWLTVFLPSWWLLFRAFPTRDVGVALLAAASAYAWADAVVFLGVRWILRVRRDALTPREWSAESVPILLSRCAAFAFLAVVSAVAYRLRPGGHDPLTVANLTMGCGGFMLLLPCFHLDIWFKERRERGKRGAAP